MADSNKLLFSQEDADSIFTELATLQVSLDNDPLALGPKRLNSKVADVRHMLSRCETIYLDVSHRLQTVRRSLRISEAELAISKQSLFANDPETRAGRSVSDREAIAGGKLIKDVRHFNDLNVTVSDLEAVLTVVKAKRGDLKDIEGRLRDQERLCQQEIGLGSHWGTARPGNRIDLSRGVATGSDVALMEDLLAHVEGEIHLQTLAGNFPTEEEAVAGEPEPPPEKPVEATAPEFEAALLKAISFVEPEPITALDPDVAPIPEDALVRSVSAESVESFLDEPLMPAEPPKSRIQKALQEAADLDMDSLLAGFESNE